MSHHTKDHENKSNFLVGRSQQKINSARFSLGNPLLRQLGNQSNLLNAQAQTSLSLTTPSLAELLGSRTIDNFTFGNSTLTNAQQAQLQTYATSVQQLLRDHPAAIIELTGHTDAPGETTDNIALGQARADSVKTFLTTQGVDTQAIITSSAGEGQLRVDTNRRDRRNRRVEIRFTTSLPFNLGLNLSLDPLPNPDGSTSTQTPRIPLPSEIPRDILIPPLFGPRRLPQSNMFDLPHFTKPPRPAFLRELSNSLTGSLGRRGIARLAGRMAAELGMDEREIRNQLDEALVDAGEAGLKELLKKIIFGIAGTPSSGPPNNSFGPKMGGDNPGTRMFNVPKIRF